MPPLLTRAEAAEFCHVSVDAFDEHVRPELPERRVGKRVLFRRVDLEAFIVSPGARGARPRLSPPKPPPPPLVGGLRRAARALPLTRGQRVRLGVGTPDEIEIEAALQEQREARRLGKPRS